METERQSAELDDARSADIRGALGTNRHSDIAPRRGWWTEAKGFYLVCGGLVALAAALVLRPGAPLGLLTNALQALAGILLPSARVFPLLLCNDEAVLGPWVDGRGLNVFTGVVIAILVMLSIILTASVFRLGPGEAMIRGILESGTVFAVAVGAALLLIRRDGRNIYTDNFGRMVWRMPPLDQLPQARLTPLVRLWLIVPRFYLGFAGIWYSCASSNLPYAATDELKRTGDLVVPIVFRQSCSRHIEHHEQHIRVHWPFF